MIYLRFNNASMKSKMHTVRVTFWALLGITIVLTNLALNRPARLSQESTTTPVEQTGTVIAETIEQNEAGSTDGIMFVAVIIVLIIVIPILLKRQVWENGKQRRTS